MNQDLIYQSLANAPTLLEELIHAVPKELHKIRRLKESWSIHEWCCHLIDTQDFLLERFNQMSKIPEIEIKAHLPNFKEIRPDYLEKEITVELNSFYSKRKNLIKKLKSFEASFWNTAFKHEEYEQFNPYILLRHIMLIDHVHLFQIEKLWLTKDQYL